MGRKVFNPDHKLIEEFLRWRCAGDILNTGVFPNAKEVTESVAMMRAIQKHVPLNRKDADITAWAIGDGCSPRTGVVMAFNTAWQIVSIDPRASHNYTMRGVKRLTVLKEKAEVVAEASQPKLDKPRMERPDLLVCCHSHAPIRKVLLGLGHGWKGHVVAMPCCVPHDLGIHPQVVTRAEGCWSPMNMVLVWRHLEINGDRLVVSVPL